MLDHSCQVQRHTLKERKMDCYETPEVATETLLREVKLPHRIWEPACGRGKISAVLWRAGHHVLSTDLVDYNCPAMMPRVDFLMERKLPSGCEAIVTNPPFKLAAEFVEHAMDIGAPMIVMLLRLAFMESDRRTPILDNGQLAEVLVFRKRLPMMHRDGWEGRKANSGMAFAWFVWKREHSGPATLRRISW